MPGSIRRIVKKRCMTDPEYDKKFKKALELAGGLLANIKVKLIIDKNGKKTYEFPELEEFEKEQKEGVPEVAIKVETLKAEEKEKNLDVSSFEIEIEDDPTFHQAEEPPPPQVTKMEAMDGYKFCKVCGEEFKFKAKNQIYCSTECRKNK